MNIKLYKTTISVLQIFITIIHLIIGNDFYEYPEKERYRKTQEIKIKLIQKSLNNNKTKGVDKNDYLV